jgi:hypothetical protein
MLNKNCGGVTMSSKYNQMLDYTRNHFIKLARENRFPENGKISHDKDMCLVCHPELIEGNVPLFFFDLILDCIAERRPKIDEDLLTAIKEELTMQELDDDIDLEKLKQNDPEAFQKWRMWAWSAVNTAFEMLSLHSASTPYLQLEDTFSENEIEAKLKQLFEKQRSNTAK